MLTILLLVTQKHMTSCATGKRLSPYCVIRTKVLYHSQSVTCINMFADDYFLSMSPQTWWPSLRLKHFQRTLSRSVLASHPQGEGDEDGGQGGAGGYSQTHHGQKSQQPRQEDIPLVPDQRLQPLTKLQEETQY